MDILENYMEMLRNYNTAKAPKGRGPTHFGFSGIGFCLEKYARQLIDADDFCNGKMLMGQFAHGELPNLLQHHPIYGQYLTTKWKLTHPFTKGVSFEVPLHFEAKSDGEPTWQVTGHADAVVYPTETVIEFKTIGSSKSIDQIPYVDAYIEQVNGYASILGFKRWEIWFIHKNAEKFDQIPEILAGEVDTALFASSLAKFEMLYQRCQVDEQLMGPAFKWECRYCKYKGKGGCINV